MERFTYDAYLSLVDKGEIPDFNNTNIFNFNYDFMLNIYNIYKDRVLNDPVPNIKNYKFLIQTAGRCKFENNNKDDLEKIISILVEKEKYIEDANDNDLRSLYKFKHENCLKTLYYYGFLTVFPCEYIFNYYVKHLSGSGFFLNNESCGGSIELFNRLDLHFNYTSVEIESIILKELKYRNYEIVVYIYEKFIRNSNSYFIFNMEVIYYFTEIHSTISTNINSKLFKYIFNEMLKKNDCHHQVLGVNRLYIFFGLFLKFIDNYIGYMSCNSIKFCEEQLEYFSNKLDFNMYNTVRAFASDENFEGEEIRTFVRINNPREYLLRKFEKYSTTYAYNDVINIELYYYFGIEDQINVKLVHKFCIRPNFNYFKKDKKFKAEYDQMVEYYINLLLVLNRVMIKDLVQTVLQFLF